MLQTPDRYLRVADSGTDSGRFVREGRYEPEPLREDQDLLRHADPRRLLGFDDVRPTWEGLAAVRKAFENRTSERINEAGAPRQGYWLELVRSDPRLYRLVLSDAASSLVAEYWFDEAAEFNAVRIHASREGVLYHRRAVTYTEQSRTHLPRRIEYEDLGPGGELTRHEVMVLVASRVNDELPPERFGIQGMGLGEGERIIDNVNGGEYRYLGGALTSQPAP